MSGIFGIVSNENCIPSLYYGTDYHSHMGTEYAGIAYVDETGTHKKQIHNVSNSQFKSKFDLNINSNAKIGIGVISDKDPQPLNFHSKFGTFSLCCSGLITNKEGLARELTSKGISFSELSNGELNGTELVAHLINQGETIMDGIEKMQSKIAGSVSLLLMTKEGIYAARDKNGVTPLIIGEKEGEVAITSETCAFPNLNLETKKFIEPGEITFISEKGIEIQKTGNQNNKICSFLWIYTGFPVSNYEGINTEKVRESCGRFLAKRDNVEVDLVAGVPDSGTAHAIGYSMESQVPYRRVLFKYTPGYGRSYTPPSQEIRDKIAQMKLIANEDTINGNRMILCEDSIVRGTQLKNFTITKLRKAGAKEVHIRPACPPLMFPCIYNLSTRSINELATRKAIRALEGQDIEDVSEYLNPESEKYKKMVKWITKDLGVDSIRYQLLNDMISAIGLPKEKLCTYCWTGKGVQTSLDSYKEKIQRF